MLRLVLLGNASLFCIMCTYHFMTSTASSSLPSVGNSSLLQLHVGLNLSFAAPAFSSGVDLIQGDQLNSFFLPILSSPGFNSSNASNSWGFSFGYFMSASGENIYLVVCGGLSGNYSDINEGFFENNPNFTFGIGLPLGGYGVPVWVANVDRPLTSINSSLVVMPGAALGNAGNVLQLRDHMGAVVWSVNDVGLMEMEDTGNLVIYDTTHKTKVVWQSLTQPRDTLMQGQKLSVGMELRSNDSANLARMEKGGLVFYLNKPRFLEHPAAYWVIPIFSLDNYMSKPVSKLDLKKLVLDQSPCGPHDPGYMVLDNATLTVDLKPGQYCAVPQGTSSIYNPDIFYPDRMINLLKLETDGRLYINVVDLTIFPSPVTRSVAIETQEFTLVDWGECGAPMACGPLGVCKPFAPSLCACPQASRPESISPFDFINSTDNSKGCRLVTPLPECIHGNEHIGTTSYLQLNETASIFLFSGWPFNASITSSRVETCMESCSYTCSCTGFFYQATSSGCFFMTDGIGLLHTSDRSMAYISDIFGKDVSASSYITYLKINSSPPGKGSGKHESTIIIVVASSVVACLLALAAGLYLFHARKSTRNRRAREKARKAEDEELRDILPLLPSRFSYQDLHEATEGFTKLLGAGGCGSVYAGVLLDGRKVAVKMLETGMLKGQQSKQFLAEVATVGRTNHHNIVCLVGFCWEVYHRLLVYEYMERGSLDQWLFAGGAGDVAKDAEQATSLLDWPTRYSVALGIARGLTYLHEECLQPILHFDIKPQNILLDDAYVAKLADFGLSKLMQRGISEVVTGVRGTPGYIAPEWISHGAVSKKCDIYSMGMVMLEIVGGRKNVDITLLNSDTSACDQWHFPSWAARKCAQGLMLELVDKRVAHAYDEEQACRLIQTAFWCIHENASMRPSAPTVLQWLEGSCKIMKQPPFATIAHAQSSVGNSSLNSGGGPN